MKRKLLGATLAIAGSGLLLAGAATLARSGRPDPEAPRPRSAPESRADPGSTDDRGNAEDLATESLDSLVADFVSRWKETGFAPGDLETWLGGLLRSVPFTELLASLGRQGPLEEGFSALRQLVAERQLLKESALRVVLAADADPETRLFALRLLPPFSLLGSPEKAALLRPADRPPDGEWGRQLVRYVSRDPTESGVSAWLSQLLDRRGDPEVTAEALRALVRFPDPLAALILKRCFENPDVPVSQRATILGALGATTGASSRYPWLPEILEQSIRFRPGDALDSDRQALVSHAVTILARNGEGRKLSCLLESEPLISEPGGRALIAFALRWLPEPEAATRLATMASNPAEALQVRRIARESLRSISDERNLPPELQAALEGLPGE